MDALVLAHAAATLIMLGVIWIVQLVHYPLFARVGAETFSTYQAEHMTRITWIVFPAMTVELVTAVALLWWAPAGLPAWLVWTGLGLVALIWGSTGVLQVPLHRTLTDGFDAAAHQRLVATNWIRTAAWTARGGLVIWMLAALLNRS
jgi:hypothetical protein